MEAVGGVVEELLARNLDTIEYYFDVYAELSAERAVLHERIIHTILSRKNYSTGKRVFMLGGAPANGKSTFLKSGSVKYPSNALKIDPDEIKTMLPEYRYMIAREDPLAAELVHEESPYISKEIRSIAIGKGYDIILDGVANDTLTKRMEDVEELRANGHMIRMDYVTLDTALSLQLAELRFLITRRKVPETFIIEKNRLIARLLQQLIENKVFDELYLWDTTLKGQPRLILSQKNAILAIESIPLYEDFKRKADFEAYK